MSEKQEIFSLLGGAVKMHRGFYNPTSDAVWLAAFAPKKVKTALDVGIGSGGVSLCLAAHNPKINIVGIDVSDDMLGLCSENIKLNKANIKLINADILNWKTSDTFDLVVSNPPYFKGTPAHHNAHHNIDLPKWIKKCVARVKPRGYIAVIIDASVLSEVISVINEHCGDITILPLFGSKNIAERVLVRARMGVKGGTVIYSGRSMNDETILRDGLTIK